MSVLTGEQSMQLASQLYAIGDFDGALARCDEILAGDPDHEAARQLAATLHYRRGTITAFRINLPQRTDRLAECRSNMAEFGYPDSFTTLLPAVLDTQFGAVGCGKSHISALIDFFIRGTGACCMVLEDDFDFLQPAATLIDNLRKIAAHQLRWDVILLTGNDVLPTQQPKHLPFLLRIFEAQSGAGYLVNRPYVATLLRCFIDTVEQMERFRSFDARKLITSRLAIDMAWKRLQRRDDWYIFNPTFGQQRAGHSDIEGVFKDYRRGTFYKWP